MNGFGSAMISTYIVLARTYTFNRLYLNIGRPCVSTGRSRIKFVSCR